MKKSSKALESVFIIGGIAFSGGVSGWLGAPGWIAVLVGLSVYVVLVFVAASGRLTK